MSGFNDDYNNTNSNSSNNMYGNSSSDQNSNNHTNVNANGKTDFCDQFRTVLLQNRATGSTTGDGHGGLGRSYVGGGTTATTGNDLSSLNQYPNHSQYHQFQPSYHQYQTNYPQQFHHHANMSNTYSYSSYHDANTSSSAGANNANQNSRVSVPGYTLNQPFYKTNSASNSIGNSSNNSNGAAAPSDNGSATATATGFDYLHALSQPQNQKQSYQTNSNYASIYNNTQQKSKENQNFLQYQSYLQQPLHGYDSINNNPSSQSTSVSNSGTKLASINNNSNDNNKITNSNNDTTSISPSIEIQNFANKFFAPNNNNQQVTTTREQQLVSLLDPLHNLKNDDTSSSSNTFHDVYPFDKESNDVLRYCAEIFQNEPNNFTSTTTSSNSTSTKSHNKAVAKGGSSSSSSSHSKILDNFNLSIISLSSSPLSATEIIDTISFRCQEVESRFIPCVDFLVTCQQELRHGLALAVQKNRRGRSCYTTQDVRPIYICLDFICVFCLILSLYFTNILFIFITL